MIPPVRWWWVRHAPLAEPARLSGRLDVDCPDPDPAALAALRSRLPAEAAWLSSPLRRARRTAALLGAAEPVLDDRLAEQDFGAWQGATFAGLEAARDPHLAAFWADPAGTAPPGGESFTELAARVAACVAERSGELAGRDVVAVAHAGPVRAALADALGLAPAAALAFEVAPLSLTRLDRFAPAEPGGRASWRVAFVNWHAP